MNIGRPLTKRLTWFTGLHYHYQQLRGETRVSLDSFGINGNPNYVNISNSIYKVHLNIHQVNVPLLLRFSFTPALDITTGLYNNISISSNWKKYEDFLGKQKTYLPVWHIQPSYGYKNFALGPYLNVGLLKYETDKRLISYGLLLKYAVSK
ncbi:MAG: hypothetical protein EOP46_19620 [Sphingobacteriaceae bacterium]|nr:MAG: hypothetical protein EOP46_19620 [Sphingobacteriaceae bacterium]